MIVFGLDLSMSKTGVAVLDKNGKIIHSELIKPKASLSHGKKLEVYFNRFNELKELFEPTHIGIEMGISRFNKSTQVIFRAHGVANLAFSEFDPVYVNTSNVKKIMTGKGNADKDMMIDAVYKKYGVKVSDDEADAIAVALCVIKDIINKE